MFGVDTSELLLIAIVALIFIGPKDLPRAMRAVGHWIGKIRGMARHFSSGVEAIVREAELEEMEKKWAEQNAQIMAQVPQVDLSDHEMRPLPGSNAEARVEEVAPPKPDAETSPPDEPQLPLR